MKSLVKLSLLFSVVLSVFLFGGNLNFVKAQTEAIDVAFTRPVITKDAKSGDIVEMSDKGLVLANTPYSTKIAGVIVDNSLIVYRKVASDSARPIARNGIVAVNVTDAGGAIKLGDYITSSSIPGKGQKVERPGYVVGVAMEDFKTEGAEKIDFEGRQVNTGSILVALKAEFVGVNAGSSGRLLDQLSSQVFQNLESQEGFGRLMRYAISGIIILVAFLIGFIIFARSIPKSIEAIGRNPLAKSQIQISIMLNILMLVVTVLLGIGAAFLIISL